MSGVDLKLAVTPLATGVVGTALPRVDGRLKVTGAARYAADQQVAMGPAAASVLHGVALCSTIARGTLLAIDAQESLAMPGVVAVLTAQDLPKLKKAVADFGTTSQPGEARLLFADNKIHYVGQYLGVVLAEHREQAQAAAARVKVRYLTEPPVITTEAAMPTAYTPGTGFGGEPSYRRGLPEREFADAAFKHKQTYRTPIEHHQPMEPVASIAVWSGDELTMYESTQWVAGARSVIAQMLDLPVEKVRVISPFVGGGFGCKGFIWPHSLLAALAAKKVGRPVKLEISRQQLVSACGHRPETLQTVALGASTDGQLRAIMHSSVSQTSTVDEYSEEAANVSRYLYRCANVQSVNQLVKVNIATPTIMRAPGEAPGLFALESALDELAYQMKLDPVRLRQKNFAEQDPLHQRRWSSNQLRECYLLGMEKIGWSQRPAKPRTLRDKNWLIGYGMATATHIGFRSAGAAKVTVQADGRVLVQSATQDMGTGTYTILTQLAAAELGVTVEQVTVELGDTRLPPAPMSGGSMTAASVGPAVQAAAQHAISQLKVLAARDPQSPLHHKRPEELGVDHGALFVYTQQQQRESFTALLRRLRLPSVVGEASVDAPENNAVSIQSFGAHFCKVRVDAELGLVRVAQHVAVLDVGRVLNPLTARSQGYSGVVMGIGMALMEQTRYDARSGRPLDDNLGSYLIPTQADVGDIEVAFVQTPDAHIGPHGARGLGELVFTGVAPAIANAIYNATGIRVRELPITPDKLLR